MTDIKVKCPTPNTVAEKLATVEFQIKENIQFLAVFVVIFAILGAIILYLIIKLATVIWRYRSRKVATRQDKEDRERAQPGSISLLNSASNDNEEYASKDSQIAEASDDMKTFSENIQRVIDKANMEARFVEDSIDKTVITDL